MPGEVALAPPLVAEVKPFKTLFMGESGSGKTCALASLLQAGYNVRMLDLDNGVDALKDILTDPKSKYSKDCIGRLAYITLTERMRFAGGRIIPANATVWAKSMGMLDKWKNDNPDLGTICDFGPAAKWTAREVLVIDTLGNLATGALNFHLQMNGALGMVRTQNEGRRDIGVAQQYITTLIQYLYDVGLKCNVIVNTHITYVKQDGSGDLTPGENAPTQGFPSTIGRALSPRIPGFFNTVLLGKVVGSGPVARRRIYTVTQGNVNLKNTAPLRLAPEYDQSTGLAEIFQKVLGDPPKPLSQSS